MAAGIVVLVVSPVLAVASVLAWTGRWRRWTRQIALGPLPMPITLFPGLAAATFAAGLDNLGIISGKSPLSVACFLMLVAGIVLYLWAPAWWGPRWYRHRDKHARPDRSDPLTALWTAASTRAGAPSSEATAARRFAGDKPLARWNATWVAGAEDGKVRGLTPAGRVGGKLSLYPDGLAFQALGIEDRLRHQPTFVAIGFDNTDRVRVVPAGAGPDGIKRHRNGPRSAFPRLVVDTSDGAYLFEVQSAKRCERRIVEALSGDHHSPVT